MARAKVDTGMTSFYADAPESCLDFGLAALVFARAYGVMVYEWRRDGGCHSVYHYVRRLIEEVFSIANRLPEPYHSIVIMLLYRNVNLNVRYSVYPLFQKSRTAFKELCGEYAEDMSMDRLGSCISSLELCIFSGSGSSPMEKHGVEVSSRER